MGDRPSRAALANNLLATQAGELVRGFVLSEEPHSSVRPFRAATPLRSVIAYATHTPLPDPVPLGSTKPHDQR